MSKNNPAYMVEVGAYRNEDGGFETVVTICRENSTSIHDNPSSGRLSELSTWAWKKVTEESDTHTVEPMAGPEWIGFTVHIDE